MIFNCLFDNRIPHHSREIFLKLTTRSQSCPAASSIEMSAIICKKLRIRTSIPILTFLFGGNCNQTNVSLALHTFTPRLILQRRYPPGLTDATTTSAPNRVSVSVMHVVSISSLSSAMGTRTLFADVDMVKVVDADDENLF